METFADFEANLGLAMATGQLLSFQFMGKNAPNSCICGKAPIWKSDSRAFAFKQENETDYWVEYRNPSDWQFQGNTATHQTMAGTLSISFDKSPETQRIEYGEMSLERFRFLNQKQQINLMDDYQKALQLIAILQPNLYSKVPAVGDIVEVSYHNGNAYPNAVVCEINHDKRVELRLGGITPFLEEEDSPYLRMHLIGGPFAGCSSTELTHTGQIKLQTLSTWSVSGKGPKSKMLFCVPVRVWAYSNKRLIN